MRTLSLQTVRQLAIEKQKLSNPMLPASAEGMLDAFRALGCIQIDSIRAVERTQYLVLWSRLGPYDMDLLRQIQFDERQVFEFWAHAASLVLTENYAIHRHMMDQAHSGGSSWSKRVRQWLSENEPFRQYVIEQIRLHGSVEPKDIEDRALTQWQSSGWSSGRNVTQMISFLWDRGELMVSDRVGLRKRWSFSDDWFSAETLAATLSEPDMVAKAVQISLSALGVATQKQLRNHFIRGYYPNLQAIFQQLVEVGTIVEVDVAGLPGPWYMLAEDMPRVDALEQGGFNGRLTFLSPFDNLICDRDRTEQLWDFRFRIEIYVPKAKREYGYYTLPILQGDRFIGRLCPKIDRKKNIMTVSGVYAEPDAPRNSATAAAIRDHLHALATWAGTKKIQFEEGKPLDWAL